MGKKYTLDRSDSHTLDDGSVLYRVVATDEFCQRLRLIHDFEPRGGYIADESCLAGDGDCWVGAGAFIGPGCRVSGDAQVWGSGGISLITGLVFAYGNAYIENSKLSGFGSVCDLAEVRASSIVASHNDSHFTIAGSSKLLGITAALATAQAQLLVWDSVHLQHTQIYARGKVEIEHSVDLKLSKIDCEDLQIAGSVEFYEADIRSSDQIFYAEGLGAVGRCFTAVRGPGLDSTIMVQCGCFTGTLEEFVEQVNTTKELGKHHLAYMTLANLANLRLRGFHLDAPAAPWRSSIYELSEQHNPTVQMRRQTGKPISARSNRSGSK